MVITVRFEPGVIPYNISSIYGCYKKCKAIRLGGGGELKDKLLFFFIFVPNYDPKRPS